MSSSASNNIALQNVAPPPDDNLPLPSHDYPQFVAQGSSDYNSSQDHASPPGGGVSSLEGKGKNNFSSEMLPQSQQYHDARDSRHLMGGLQMQLEPSLQGLGHSAGMQSSSSNTESFRNLLGSQDDSSLQPDQTLGTSGLRYSATDEERAGGGAIGTAARSLSHPNLSTIPSSSRTLPPGQGMRGNIQPSTAVPSHSQAPIPFPTNLGGFTLSSMVGHFASHPQLQAQSLSVNPASGLMQGLGISVGSNHNQPPLSNTLAQSLSLSNPQMLGGAQNPSISIMNAPTSLSAGGGGRPQNLSHNVTSLPMPLAHPIASNLQNPAGLPLLSGMPNMYSYPYTAGTLPTQPVTTSIVHVNAPPGFPSQSLMQGYSQYIPPSLYGNAPQQPPVSTANFSR